MPQTRIVDVDERTEVHHGILDHPVWGATPFLAKVKRGSVAL